TDLNGQPVSLYSAFGQNKLTVVCFWKANFPLSLEEVGQLQTYVAGPYAAKGVKVIAINEDDPPNVAAAAFQKEKAAYPCLLDPRGSYFAQVATQELPRTYLVNSEGKILWFDIKYSALSTRRALEQAIQFVLKEGAEPKSE
ncbi:MAG: TlpA disulfide reductase family protein, partial [Planctomycetia bacterium]